MIEKISGDTAYFEAALTSEDLADLLADVGIRLIRAWGGYRPSTADLEKLNDLFRLRPEIEFCATEPGQLVDLPELQRVSEAVSGCFGEGLSDLKALKRLRSLGLTESNFTALPEYADTLEELSLSGRFGKKSGACLSKLTRLKALSLSGTTLDSFACIGKLKLTSLYVYGNRPNSPAGLEALTSLRALRVKNNSSWTDFSFLTELRNLESLCLEYCAKLRVLVPLDALRQLRYVRLGNCDNLEDISSLQRLTADCEVFATGRKLLQAGIAYEYSPKTGVAEWCREASLNLPAELLARGRKVQ
jgi:expression site-associated gene 8 (ESAG8) protein